MPSGSPFGTIFARQKMARESLQKKGVPIRKWGATAVSCGSQGRHLACAFLEQETIARARNVVRICVHGSGSEKLIVNGCLGWLQLQMFQKTFEEMEMVNGKNT